MANVQSARIKPAFGGMNSESSPEYVPDNQSAVLENLLPRPGKVVLRGPISSGIDLGVAAYNRIDGAMVYGSGIRLRVDDTTMKEIQSGVVSAGVGGEPPGLRFCALGAYAYGIADPNAATSLTRWDGSGAAVSLVNGPLIAADITVHLSRLFYLGRRTNSNELRWTDVGGPVADTAAEWQDDVSGLVNRIVVGDANDLGRALGHVGKQLAIFKDKSIWMLTGLTPSTFAVNRITNEWGCAARDTVVDHDDGCFFLSDRGFAYFDGSSVSDVSGDIKTELLAAIRQAPFPFDSVTTRYGVSSTLAFARAAAIGRDCIMLTIGRENTSAAVPIIYFCGIYDVRQRTWTKFSSDAFAAGAPVYFIPTPASSYYAGATLGYDGGGNLMYLDDLVAPESSVPSLGGKDTVDGTTATIPAVSHSRIVALASPGKTSQLQRLLIDYTFVVVADGETSVNCCSVQLVDGQGNELLPVAPIEATILASGYTDDERRAALVRKRFQVECFAEASEVQLRVTLPALDLDVTEVVAAEIHDATIEFIPGRDRPTM